MAGPASPPRHGARVDALAVDPVYAVPADRLVVRMAGELARGSRWTEEHRDHYVWEHHGSPADHARLRAASAELCTRDLHAAPERYVPGALPSLPFRDGSVDLVLSSHLTFTYADRLDVDFHNAVPDLLDTLLADRAPAGVPSVVRPVAYEFQRGATRMLQPDAR